MKRTSLAICAALICASTPFAIGQASPQSTVGTSQSGRLDGFVGDGICTGHMMAIGKNPGRPTTGKYHGEKTLDGHWIVLHYQQDRSAANPKPFEVMQYFGYDPAAKRFITVMVGNGDGAYSVGVSRGWQGNSLTFDEVEMARGKRGSSREALTTEGSGLSSYTGWFRDKRGNWVKFDEETCHRS